MWLVLQLSIRQLSAISLLEKQVAMNNWSSSLSTIFAFSSCYWFLLLHMTASCPILLNLLLSSGLLQHLKGGWPFLSPALLLFFAAELSPTAWVFLFFCHLLFPSSLCLASKAPSRTPSCLMTRLYSCACKALKSSASVILDKFFAFSKVVIVASNLLGSVTKIFSTILESLPKKNPTI